MNPYAANKAICHLDRLHEYRNKGVPYPVHVHFVISDLCNQRCSFCAYRWPGYTETFAEVIDGGGLNWNPSRMIDVDKASDILGQLSSVGIKAVQFTGGGEPTVHKGCAELMLLANKLGMETALVTNGKILNDDLIKAILQTTWVRISLDHANPKGYARMRNDVPGAFDRVKNHILDIVKARRKKKSPTIGVGFVVNKDNWQEIIHGAALAKELGVDNIRLSAVFQPDDYRYFEHFEGDAREACAHAVTKFSDDRFQVINNFPSRIGDLELKHPDYIECPYQYFTTFIGADLNVYRCCVTSYTALGLVGSLADEHSFSDLWTSEERQRDRMTFDARRCPRCQFNDKNRAIHSMLDVSDITHGSFV